MNSKKRLTPERVYEQLQEVYKITSNPKEPVRYYHLMTSELKGTQGVIASPIFNLLRKNNILIKTNNGFIWNDKIPVTPKLATRVAQLYAEYRDSPESGLPCSVHSREPQKVRKPKVNNAKTTVVKQEGWLKRFIKSITNVW